MGHLNPTEPSKTGGAKRALRDRAAEKPLVDLGLGRVLALGGFWYYRGSQANSQALDSGAPGSSGFPGGNFRAQAAMPPVPVVVATAERGDLPVYFNGLGTVTAFNTVTVRSRVDGAIVKVNFTEGQFVHEGDALGGNRSAPLSSGAGTSTKASWPRIKRN